MSPDFDREPGREDLERMLGMARLAAEFSAAVGAPVALRGNDGSLWAGEAPRGAAASAPVALDLEPLFTVEVAGSDPARAAALAAIAGRLLRHAWRYRMVADLHTAAVNADYQALLDKNARLEESEARYRRLAAELEQRVADQVALIEATQRGAFQEARLAAVGRLAAGVAHEINNPLGFMRSNLATARAYLAELVRGAADAELLADFDQLLGETMDGADRVARIVDALRMASGVDQGEQSLTRLDEVLHSAVALLAPRLPRGARIDLDLGHLSPVPGRAGAIQQVLLDLMLNAVQALAPGGVVTVRAACRDGQARVEISDDGCGIAAADLDRVFDPFYTTRPLGQGSGLGLTLARDTVRAQGGDIELDSAPGRGTTVRLAFPLEDAARAA